MKLYLRLGFCMATIACAGCAAEKVVTHIDSQPQGARVEVNEAFVGTTPVDVTLPQRGEHHRLEAYVVVKASPVNGTEGEFKQSKLLQSHQEAPSKLLFIMTEPPPQKPGQ